jgi:hypothetical protein
VLRSAFHSVPGSSCWFRAVRDRRLLFPRWWRRMRVIATVQDPNFRARRLAHRPDPAPPRPPSARPEDPSLDTAPDVRPRPRPAAAASAHFPHRAPAPKHDDSGRRASIPLLTSPLSPAPNAPLRVGVGSRGATGPDGTSTAPAETALIVPMRFFAFVGRYRLRVRRPLADTGDGRRPTPSRRSLNDFALEAGLSM